MKLIKVTLGSIATLVIAFLFFLGWSTINDYDPEPQITLSKQNAPALKKDTFSILIWNIGYAGLGDDMDFFYDGGEQMRTSKNRTDKNFQNILKELKKTPQPDFLLLQEVDIDSKRSYHQHQVERIKSEFQNHNWYFAHNYLVDFVPMPLGNPLGKVESGIISGSLHSPSSATRYSYQGNFGWPKSVFMLDRCFLSLTYPLSSGDTLFIVNTHNTAYDEGALREKQMHQLKNWIKKRDNSQNKIIVAGDWNQLPPEVKIDEFGTKPQSKKYSPKKIPQGFLPEGWQFIFDPHTPTNRGLDTFYHSNSYKTIIDFFAISPGIKPIEIKTTDLSFINSDHQPVYLKFTFVHQKQNTK